MAKRALLVGVNKYMDPQIDDLRGCVNDVTNMRDLLKGYFDFTNEEIRVVVDERATKGNIMYRLEEMVNLSKSGDTLIFHFSGHGSQIRDRDGDELKDKLDEILCPHDCGWDDNFIVDDELADLMAKLPDGVHAELLFDSCHSGTATRSMPMFMERPPEEVVYRKARYAPPPMDIVFRADGDEDILTTRKLKAKPATVDLNHVLWTGCRDSQYSSDAFLSGAYHGAFTFWFCRHVRRAGGGIARSTLVSRIRNSLKRYGFDQTPQLESVKAESKELVFQD